VSRLGPRITIGLLAALTLVVVATEPATAGPLDLRIKLQRAVGPPTTTTTLRGSGFGTNEVIDVTFDGADLRRAMTGPQGRFLTRISVPASALPGEHEIRAIGETSGLVSRAAFLVRTDWAKALFDAGNTSHNRFENVLDPSNVGGLIEKWHVSDDCCPHSAAVVGAVVYLAGSTGLQALDARTGSSKWSTSLEGNMSGQPAVADGLVFVGADGSSHGAVYALDAASGALRWTYVTTTCCVSHAPSVVSGVVYVVADGGALLALDGATGARNWTSSSAGVRESQTPAAANGRVYVTGYSQDVFAFDTATGTLDWTAPTAGFFSRSAVAADGMVFVGADDGTLTSLDASTGDLAWSQTFQAGIYGPVAVADGMVFVGTTAGGTDSGRLNAVDEATGSSVWSLKLKNPMTVAPTVANGIVYVPACSFALCAVDEATGLTLWTTLPSADSSPVVADGVIYASSSFRFYAFGLP
jgi:outer membrane protein assembly factor BamB